MPTAEAIRVHGARGSTWSASIRARSLSRKAAESGPAVASESGFSEVTGDIQALLPDSAAIAIER
ncbi:hypothetical protein Acsp05_44030 [Actinokineospora sp. NBRC 105648]|nr:hypothetical protein Acsp05_44030 [Actinokineospora sp. NBRC 105648]